MSRSISPTSPDRTSSKFLAASDLFLPLRTLRDHLGEIPRLPLFAMVLLSLQVMLPALTAVVCRYRGKSAPLRQHRVPALPFFWFLHWPLRTRPSRRPLTSMPTSSVLVKISPATTCIDSRFSHRFGVGNFRTMGDFPSSVRIVE